MTSPNAGAVDKNGWISRLRWLLPTACVAGFLAMVACGGDQHAASLDGSVEGGPVGTGTGAGDVCATSHEEGCPCDDAGATASCQAVRHAGLYTSCGPGLRTCGDAGKWGPCYGPIK